MIGNLTYGILDHIWSDYPCSTWDIYLSIAITLCVCCLWIVIIKIISMDECYTKAEKENRMSKIVLLSLFCIGLLFAIDYISNIHSEKYNNFISEKKVYKSSNHIK